MTMVKSHHWDAGPGQPVKFITKIQKLIGAGSTKGKCFVEYKDQIIIGSPSSYLGQKLNLQYVEEE